MAQIETWLKQDIKQLVSVVPLRGNIFSGDNDGNLIGVEVFEDGQPYNMTGNCYGYVIKADNQTEFVPGTVSGNKAQIVLPSICYNVVGPVSIVIKTGVTVTNNVPHGGVTIAACTSYVYRSQTDVVDDATNHILPSYNELADKLEDLEAKLIEAGRVNITQNKSGNVITVTTTDRNGTVVNKTLQEPTVSVTPNDGDFDLNVTDANGSQTVTIPNPNKELSDRAHVETVSRSKTHTGNPIQIEDAVNEIADKTVIKLVPKQDLHGYSRPWVGGAGKNKLDETSPMRGCYTQGGVFLTDGTYPQNYISYKLTLPAGTYTFSTDLADCFIVRYLISDVKTEVQRATQTVSFTLSAEAEVKFSLRNTSTSSIASVTPNSMIEVGSTATAFEPYTNLCPISGYDTVNLMRRGNGNLFNGVFTDNKYITSGGSTASIQSGYKAATDYIPVKENTAYTISGIGVNNRVSNADPAASKVTFYNSSKTVVTGTPQSDGYTTNTFTFTTPAGTAYIKFHCGIGATDVVVNEGSKSEFAHYPIAVSLATNGNQTAGTVYSGTVTLLADGSGQVVVDRKCIDLGDYTWTYASSQHRFYISPADAVFSGNSEVSNIICSKYGVTTFGSVTNEREDKVIAGSTTAGGTYLTVRDTDYSDATVFKTAVTGTQVVYPLATPVTYTLTADQVKTLLGYNYIYTDGTEIALTYRQESLATNETLLKLLPTGTATGNPVTFSDGADSVPLKQLVVNVQPNQDLHGYEKPWVAGGGKNLMVGSPSFEGYARNGTFWTKESQTYNGHEVFSRSDIWNGMYKDIYLPVGDYTFSLAAKADASISVTIYIKSTVDAATANTISKNITVGTAWARYYINFSVTAAGNVSCRLEKNASSETKIYVSEYMLTSGTTTATDSYAPYENICPIRGWDSVPIIRTGKNLFDVRIGSTANKLRGDDGTESDSTSSSYTDPICGFAPNTQYTLQGTIIAENQTFRLYFLDANKNFLSRTSSISSTPYTFTTPDDCYYVQLQYITTKAVFSTIQIEEGTTATAFEPFKGKVYDISIPSEAGTVYGCQITLDENGEGTLTVNTEKLVAPAITEFTGTSSTGNYKYVRLISNRSEIDVTLNTNNVLSECFESVSYESPRTPWSCYSVTSTQNGNSIMAFADVRTTVAEFNNAVQGTILIAKLANPVTYHLTADQVKTLLGTNIISSDAGNVSVKYFKVLGEEQDLSGYAKKNNPVFTGTNFKFGGNTFSASDMDVLRILIDEWLDATGGYPVEPADPNSGGNGGIEEYAPVEPGTGGGSGGSEVAEEPAEP